MITDGDYSRPERAIDGRPGIISREFKRDVYENEKDLAFAKSSSILSYGFPLCSQDNSIYPWRIEGITPEQRMLTSQFYFTISRLRLESLKIGNAFSFCSIAILGEGCDRWFSGTDLQRVDLLMCDKGRIGMGPRAKRQSEFLLIYQKPPIAAKTTWIGHAIPDVWREKTTKKHVHNKPVALQMKLTLATTSPGDVILDPAAGSYSVMQAVSDLGDRHFLGCDLIDPIKYP